VRHNTEILALYLAHRRELVNYASGIVGNRAQAEDLVQEAWLRFGAVAERRLLEEPIGYLYRIVRNLAVDDRRRLVREEKIIAPDSPTAAESADGLPSPEAQAAARDELRRLKDALAILPERTRIALEMRRFGGCKLKDIAAHLGISITVAHDIVAEGIAHCRRYVRPHS
jgi:RNA polymerase sigma factor (sigma-70 family)